MTTVLILVFTALVLLISISIVCLIWIDKRQKLGTESYMLHELIQKDYYQLTSILNALEPLMKRFKDM